MAWSRWCSIDEAASRQPSAARLLKIPLLSEEGCLQRRRGGGSRITDHGSRITPYHEFGPRPAAVVALSVAPSGAFPRVRLRRGAGAGRPGDLGHAAGGAPLLADRAAAGCARVLGADRGALRRRHLGVRRHRTRDRRCRSSRSGMGRDRGVPAGAVLRAGRGRLAGGGVRGVSRVRHPQAAADPLLRAHVQERIRGDARRSGRGRVRECRAPHRARGVGRASRKITARRVRGLRNRR